MSRGIVIGIAGVWLIFQVSKGDLIKRVGLA